MDAERCPSCGSHLLQALRWTERPDGDVDVGLRCPECESCFRVRLSPQRMDALAARQGAARETILAAYERLAGEGQQALLANLEAALALEDLRARDLRPPPEGP